MPSWPRLLPEYSSKSSAHSLLSNSPSSSSLNSNADSLQRDFNGRKRGRPIPMQGLHPSLGLQAEIKRRRFAESRQSSSSSVGTSSADADSPPAYSPEFLQALESGRADDIDSLLRRRPELIHSKDLRGRGPVHIAAFASQVTAIADLVQRHHADANDVDSNGNTALHVAVERNDVPTIAALLNLGVDIKKKNNTGDTAFHTAVRGPRLEALQELLARASADVDAPGLNGETALDLAASLNRVDLVELLIQHREHVFGQKSLENFHVMHLAALRRATDVLKRLLEHGTGYCGSEDLLKLEDEEKGTPLHAAVHSGNETAVKLLLDHGASITAQTRELSTPLHLACSQGSASIVQLICSSVNRNVLKMALDTKDDHGMTPLHKAVMYNHWELIDDLVKANAPVDAQDSEGRTPLVLAAAKAAQESVVELLQIGADVKIRNHEGRNFFHLIVLTGGNQNLILRELDDEDLAATLLNEKDKHGCTPFHYAAQKGFGNTSQELLRLGPIGMSKNLDEQSPLHFAASFGRYHTVKRLLESRQGMGVINDSDREGFTPLHLAALGGHSKVLQLLLANGALIHKDHKGKTPLHLAATRNSLESAVLLVKSYRYLVDVLDQEGNSPLHDAAAANSTNCLTFLLDASALLYRNKTGLTALDLATAGKHSEAALAMVNHARGEEILSQPSGMFGWPVFGLIKELPEVMRVALDRCKTSEYCHPLSPGYFITYDFRLLDPKSRQDTDASTDKTDKDSLQVLKCMIDNRRVELLTHGVSKNYLDVKWMSYGMHLHFLNLLVYTVFLVLLTFLLLRGIETDLKPRMQGVSVSHLHKYMPDYNSTHFGPILLAPERITYLPPLTRAFLFVVIIFTSAQLVKKLFQIGFQGLQYFWRLVNYMELVLYVTALVFAIGFLDIKDNWIRWQAQWICGAVAAFFSWMNLILHFQRYGKLGIYVNIFFREMRVYFKATAVYFIMVIAFSITFCILNPEKLLPDRELFYQIDHKDDDPGDFQTAHFNLQSSLIRISDMLVGDVDSIQNYINPLLSDMLLFPEATYFMALVTVGVITMLTQAILMAIVVQNLQEVERSASLNILAMLVVLLNDLEERLPRRFLARVNRTHVRIYPNQSKWRSFRQWVNIFTVGGLDKITGQSARGASVDLDETEAESRFTTEELNQSLTDHQKRLRTIYGRMDQQRETLRSIVQHMEINMEGDLVDDPASAQRRISRYAVARQPRPRQLWKQLQTAQKLKSALRKTSASERKTSPPLEDTADHSARSVHYI